jgi:hypothetical protein
MPRDEGRWYGGWSGDNAGRVGVDRTCRYGHLKVCACDGREWSEIGRARMPKPCGPVLTNGGTDPGTSTAQGRRAGAYENCGSGPGEARRGLRAEGERECKW